MTAAPPPARFADVRTQLFVLALANFAIGFGAFVVVAILPALAAGLGVSDAGAGLTMTSYAIAYGIGSPLGVALTSRFERRNVIVCGLAVFGVGALLCALAPSLSMLLIARALAAIGAGVVTPVAASVAIALVSEQERGRALAFVFGGLTLSQAIGMPIGAWLGYSVGWRETFALAGLLAFPAAIVLFRQLPTGLVVPVTNLRSLVDACTRPKLLAAIAFTVFFMGGVWTLYTFFAPVLTVSFGLDGTGVSALLLVFGIGAVLGNVLGGRLTDSLGPDRTLACLCLGQAISMPLFTVGIFSGTAAGATEIIAAGALTLGWSIVGWSFMVPQQARLAALDPALAPVLLALNAAAIYLAAALGSANGGYVLDALGMVALGPVSVVLIIAALVSIPVTRRLRAAPAADGLDPADVERTES